MLSRLQMTSDPLEILVRHHHWATGVLLDRCAGLTDDQFHRRFPIGLGSLHDTLDHIIGCVEHWIARIRGEKWQDWEARQTIEQLRSRLEACSAAVRELAEELLRVNAMDQQRTLTFPQESGGSADVTFTAGAAIVHCLVHGSYHFSQAVNMLRQLNLPGPLPELDVMDWHYETENRR